LLAAGSGRRPDRPDDRVGHAARGAALCEVTLKKIASDPTAGAAVEQCEQGCGQAGAARCREGKFLDRCPQDLVKEKGV